MHFLVEMFGTFILSSVIFNVTHSKNKNKDNNNLNLIVPPIIGCTVGVLICIFGPLTQAGLNPARDYGPRIVAYIAGWKLVAFGSSIGSSFFVYVIGPIIGAILGALYTDRILYQSIPQKNSK
jgi:glycerol uptake facilitator protein